MITHKQYPNHHIFETEIGGRTFTVETGKVAELCNAEAICRYGDTVVLVTAVASPLPKSGIDYFPLTIEVEERMYAVGRIPGSFNRREGKPSDRGVLISRLIDRPMRPLFDEELRNDVVLTNTILAQDYDNPVEIVASIGSSLVIAYSDIPWNGPTATTNVCYLDGKYIVNPSQDERNACQCFVTIASTHEKVVMIETEANEVKEDILMECIKLAHETNVKVVEFINTIVDTIGKPKFTFEKAAVNHEMLDDLCEYGLDKIAYALDTDDKNVREERLTAAVVDFKEKFGEKYADDWDVQIDVCLYKMQKKIVKKWLLEGKRVDGRTPDEIRPLDAEVGVLPRVHACSPAVRRRSSPSARSTRSLPRRSSIPSTTRPSAAISTTTTCRSGPPVRRVRAAPPPAAKSVTARLPRRRCCRSFRRSTSSRMPSALSPRLSLPTARPRRLRSAARRLL